LWSPRVTKRNLARHLHQILILRLREYISCQKTCFRLAKANSISFHEVIRPSRVLSSVVHLFDLDGKLPEVLLIPHVLVRPAKVSSVTLVPK